MTAIEIAKRIGQAPNEVIAFIHENATFPVKRNFQTGDIIIPDDVDIAAFFAPLIDKELQQRLQREKQREKQVAEQKIRQEQLAVTSKIQQDQNDRLSFENQHSVSVAKLKASGSEGYYQYKVISLMDIGGLFRSNSGRVNTEAMMQTLNELGVEGWRLVTAYSNELGKNAMSGGAGGVLLGVNSTVDENILIFERFVKF